MTPHQRRRLYFPKWHQVARAHGWVMENGRMLTGPRDNWGHGPGPQEIMDAIWTSALEECEKVCRAVTPEDLRHACTWVATLRTTSSQGLRNAELDRLLLLFRILLNPDNLEQLMEWSDPTLAEKRNRIAWIEQEFRHDHVIAICLSIHRTRSLSDLTLSDLRRLAGLLSMRPGSRKEYSTETAPF